MAINSAPSVTEKDIKLLIKSLNALTEKFSQSSLEGGRTFSNTAPTRKPLDPNKRAREAEKIMRNAIKPTIGPFAKIMGRFVESAFGRAMIHWVGTTKSYFSNFANQASSLMNKAFGQFLDDLQPIIQTLKTSMNFLYDVILKPIAKLFSGVAKWGWSKITGAFDAIKDKFTIKKKPEEIVAKATVKQVDYLKRIDLNTRRIERNTRKEGSAYRRMHLSALLMGMGNKTPKPEPSVPGADTIKTTGNIVGGIFGFLEKGRQWVSNLFGGGLLGSLITIGIPILLASGFLKGLWDKFMDKNPKIKKWITENITNPIESWWTTKKGELHTFALDMGKYIGKGFIWVLKQTGIYKFLLGDEKQKQTFNKNAMAEDNLINARINEFKKSKGASFYNPYYQKSPDLIKAEKEAEEAANQVKEFWKKDKEKKMKRIKQWLNWGKKFLFSSNNTSSDISAAGFIGTLRPELYSVWNKFWGTNNAYASPTPLSPITKNTTPSLTGNSITIPLTNPITKKTAISLTGNSVTIPLTQIPPSPYNDALLTPYTSEGTIDADKMLEKVSQHELSGKKNWNQLHFPGTNNTAMGPLGLTKPWWETYSKMTLNATQDVSARGDETEVRAVWKTALKDYEKELKAKGVKITELNLMMCHFMGAKTAASYLAKGKDFMMHEVWKDPVLKANKAEGLSFYQLMARVAERGHFSTSGAILDTSGSTGETIGDWFQNVSRKIGKAVGLTPAEMQTLFNPAPRTSVEAADREREQNKKYREIGEYNPNEKPGNTTLVNNNNVANSSTGSGYSQAPRIFDSVFPQFEWVLVNH